MKRHSPVAFSDVLASAQPSKRPSKESARDQEMLFKTFTQFHDNSARSLAMT